MMTGLSIVTVSFNARADLARDVDNDYRADVMAAISGWLGTTSASAP